MMSWEKIVVEEAVSVGQMVWVRWKEELSEVTDSLPAGVKRVNNNWEFWPEKLEDECTAQKDGTVWVHPSGGECANQELDFGQVESGKPG